MMYYNDLLKLNRIGLIPGPLEKDEDFYKRVSYALSLQEALKTLTEFPLQDPVSESSPLAKNFYGIDPDWTPIFYNNYKLSFWQGGVAWIFQMTEHSSLSSLIQLRVNFEKKETYLGIYNKQELLAHEYSHVGRMSFEEPRFEEILAYSSSSSPFRRYWGPLFQSSYESLALILLFFVVFFVNMTALFTKTFPAALLALQFIPLIYLGYLTIRLIRRQNTFAKAQKNAGSHVLYRMTDKEIEMCAARTPEEIKKYVLENRKNSLRLEQIAQAYFDPKPLNH